MKYLSIIFLLLAACTTDESFAPRESNQFAKSGGGITPMYTCEFTREWFMTDSDYEYSPTADQRIFSNMHLKTTPNDLKSWFSTTLTIRVTTNGSTIINYQTR